MTRTKTSSKIVDITPSGTAWMFSPKSYWEEIVRHLFVSSAAALIKEVHVDGLRVDLTQAIHRDNRLHADEIHRRTGRQENE